MREIKPMTHQEISNYRENMRRIEELNGHSIPPGLLNIEDIGRPMTHQEISDTRENIKRVNELSSRRSNPSYHNDCNSNYESSGPANILQVSIIGIVAILMGLEFMITDSALLGLIIGGFGILCIISVLKELTR